MSFVYGYDSVIKIQTSFHNIYLKGFQYSSVFFAYINLTIIKFVVWMNYYIYNKTCNVIINSCPNPSCLAELWSIDGNNLLYG